MEETKIYLDNLISKKIPISEDSRINAVVIDGDGFAYIVGWNFSGEFSVTSEVLSAIYDKLDQFIDFIIKTNEATHYIGILEAETDYETPDEEYEPVSNFRTKYAITQKYKGKRPDRPDWYKLWAPYIQKRLIEKWGFQRVSPNIEADDLVVSIVSQISKVLGVSTVMAGNDKDLMQCPGIYYNYKKNESIYITPLEAVKNLYTQVLMGDSTDNIVGLKGCGKKTAETIVSNPKFNELSAYMYTLREFVLKLGEMYGIPAFSEAYMLCKLRTDLSIGSYYLTKYDPEESELAIQMKELLGEEQFDEILKENNIPQNFGNNNLFKIKK